MVLMQEIGEIQDALTEGIELLGDCGRIWRGRYGLFNGREFLIEGLAIVEDTESLIDDVVNVLFVGLIGRLVRNRLNEGIPVLVDIDNDAWNG